MSRGFLKGNNVNEVYCNVTEPFLLEIACYQRFAALKNKTPIMGVHWSASFAIEYLE